ncbi:MAG: glutamate--tRNA ligase, partial [Candidatus Njordarchaeia archaeon]
MFSDEEFRELEKQALINAVLHDGKANPSAVVKKALALFPNLKAKMKDKKSREEIMKTISSICNNVNKLGYEKQIKQLESEYGVTLSDLKAEQAKKTREGLPPLPDVDKVEQVITRFAPAPSGALHIGQVLRAAFINYLYAKMYNGKFVLRIEDTDPRRIKEIYYEWIQEDLKALGIEWDEIVYESEHFEEFYKYTEELFKKGKAYVCTCSQEEFQKYRASKKPCPHRNKLDKVENWRDMLAGKYREGEAIVRLKTDMAHPNPALRDPPLLRIIDSFPHPLTGYRYMVYPLYNFAVVIEDHLSKITHVIRGKEHQTNEEIQLEIYKAFGWEPPRFIEYGMIKLPELKIHKRHIRSKLREGQLLGWDDVTLPTIRSFLRRGIHPKTFENLSLLVGVSKSDITLDYENIYSHNRQILSEIAKRIYFVEDPYTLIVEDAPDKLLCKMEWIPGKPEMGYREYIFRPEKNGELKFYVSKSDLEILQASATRNNMIRLKDLMNVTITHINKEKKTIYARFHSADVAPGISKIHWCP